MLHICLFNQKVEGEVDVWVREVIYWHHYPLHLTSSWGCTWLRALTNVSVLLAVCTIICLHHYMSTVICLHHYLATPLFVYIIICLYYYLSTPLHVYTIICPYHLSAPLSVYTISCLYCYLSTPLYVYTIICLHHYLSAPLSVCTIISPIHFDLVDCFSNASPYKVFLRNTSLFGCNSP